MTSVDASLRPSLPPETVNAEAGGVYREMVEHSIIATALVSPVGRFLLVNRAMCDLLGYDAEVLVGKTWQDLTTTDHLETDLAHLQESLAGRIDSYRTVKQYVCADGHRIWGNVSVSSIPAPGGEPRYFVCQIVDVTAELEVRTELDEARRRQSAADALYRRSMENAAVGMALARADGTLLNVNAALCEFFGYDAETLSVTPWSELTADLSNFADLIAGSVDSYRGVKQYVHADGHRIWGDGFAGCLRAADGSVETVVIQIVDVTASVAAREQLAFHESRNRALAQRLSSELRSAADYVESVLPGDLHGQVEVSSRYRPSLELGGDCFYYTWIDADHFLVYLIDVSGHGIRPALLSMSVHNLLRSGSLPTSILVNPERVLSKLNNVFRMEDQDGSYFTIWYGVFDATNRSLRYASAGHPPALAFTATTDSGWQCTPLSTPAPPVGMFADSEFHEATYTVPAGCRMLLFSDGAFDHALPDGQHWSLGDFITVATRLVASNRFSLDTLIERLQARTAQGSFDDDCSLIWLHFE